MKLEKYKMPRTLAMVPRPDGMAPNECLFVILLTIHFVADSPPAFCIFEYVYFARPDSMFEGQVRLK